MTGNEARRHVRLERMDLRGGWYWNYGGSVMQQLVVRCVILSAPHTGRSTVGQNGTVFQGRLRKMLKRVTPALDFLPVSLGRTLQSLL